MTPVVRLLEAGLLAWFGAFALLVIIRVLRDGMAPGGMLVSDPDKRSVDPERVVALAIVPAVLAFYTIPAMNTGLVKTSTGWSMPDLPEGLVSLLTGGNGLYLAGKIARRS
jgi:hypothetical protein